MKLSDWCKKQGIKYLTGYRWFKSGKMPDGVHAHQTPSGTILVDEVSYMTFNNVNGVATGITDSTSVFNRLASTVASQAHCANASQFFANSSIYLSDTNTSSQISTEDWNDTPVGASVTFNALGAHIKFDQPFVITSLDQKINYDEARDLADMMVSAGLLAPDPLAVDQQTKTICTWNRSAYDSVANLVMKK
jgi:hypothetical protein